MAPCIKKKKKKKIICFGFSWKAHSKSITVPKFQSNFTILMKWGRKWFLLKSWKQSPHVAIWNIFINYKGICKNQFVPSTHTHWASFMHWALHEKLGIQRWIGHDWSGRGHNTGRQSLLFITTWPGFPCPVPTSGSSFRILDFNSQRTILWGEGEKEKKMTTVNPAKVAGLSRNIATLWA